MNKPFRLTIPNSARTLGLLIALATSVFAQQKQPGTRVAVGEVNGAIQSVEALAQDLHQGVQRYHQHLQAALDIYGRGFEDPTYGKLAGFDADIQSGDPEQTRHMKLAAFASMLVTANIHYDPDPLHDLEGLQRLLDGYGDVIAKAEDVKRLSQTVAWGDPDAIPARNFKELTQRLRTAEQHAEKARDRAQAAFPIRLDLGNTIAVAQSVDGPNLHGEFFGIQIGNDLGNVQSQLKLTYVGHAAAGELFVQNFLKANAGKTRVDTFVSSRSILLHSDPQDRHRYGYAVTAHDYGTYTVTGARVANVTGSVQNWVWKALPPQPSAATPAVSELQRGIRKIQDARETVDRAIDAFRQLSGRAIRKSDDAVLAEAKSTGGKSLLPEEDLKLYFPDVRARLYASRALAGGDRRFVGGKDAVIAALNNARLEVQSTWELFKTFNALAAYEHPELQWKQIDGLARDFMAAAGKLESGGARLTEVLPPAIDASQPVVTAASLQFPPTVIVSQKNLGTNEDGAPLIFEDIFRSVHPAVKGIGRIERTSQLVTVSPESGIHRVVHQMAPVYISGESIRQIYQQAVEDEPRGFSLPDKSSISPASGAPQVRDIVSTSQQGSRSPLGE